MLGWRLRAIDVTFPIASFPSSPRFPLSSPISLSLFLCSRDFSFRQLRHAYHAQDTSGENKLGLFIGLIKKIKQKKGKRGYAVG